MNWHRLPSGPHAGRTVPEVFFIDPDYLFKGFEAREFNGAVLADAAEVCRLATHIRVPRGEDEEQEVAVLYHLLPDGSFGGFVIVAMSDPRLPEFQKYAAARSAGLDVSIPRRIAPSDATATKGMVEAVLFQFYRDPNKQLPAADCAAFFENNENFLDGVVPSDGVGHPSRRHALLRRRERQAVRAVHPGSRDRCAGRDARRRSGRVRLLHASGRHRHLRPLRGRGSR